MEGNTEFQERLNASHILPIALYTILIVLGVVQHELWRDEIHIWLMAVNATNLTEFLSFRAVESDAILWHIIVFLLAKITDSFVIAQVFNILISIGCVYIIFRLKSLRNIEKWLLTFGYYSMFEFSVITRNYALGMFFLLIMLKFLEDKRWGIALLFMVLMSFAHLLYAILGGVVLLYLVMTKKIDVKRFLVTGILMFLSFMDVFWQTFVNWNHPNTTSSTLINEKWVLYKLSLIFKGFVPIPNLLDTQSWNSNVFEIIDHATTENLIMTILLSVLMWCIYQLFKKEKKLLLSIGVGMLMLFILFGFFWGGSQRHWGFYFLLFLVMLLLYRQVKNDLLLGGNLLVVLLNIQTLAGVMIWSTDIIREFSLGGRASKYLNETNIYVYPDMMGDPISYHTQREVYGIQSGDLQHFVDWNNSYEQNEAILISRIDSLLRDDQNMVVLSNTYNKSIADEVFKLAVEKGYTIRVYDGAMEEYENYMVVYDF